MNIKDLDTALTEAARFEAEWEWAWQNEADRYYYLNLKHSPEYSGFGTWPGQSFCPKEVKHD